MAAQTPRLSASFENRLPVLLGQGRAEQEGKVEAGKEEEDDIEACRNPAVHHIGKAIEDASGSSQKCCEKVVLTIGVILAVAQGLSAPAIALFMGESITTLAVADHAKEIEAMTPEFIKAQRTGDCKTQLYVTSAIMLVTSLVLCSCIIYGAQQVR